MRHLRFCLCFLVFTIIPCVRAQNVPPLINYQGQLTSDAGSPLLAGTYSIQFRIWDSPTAASASDLIWGQQQNVLVETNGVFNAILGSPGGSAIPGTTPAVNNLAYAFNGSNCFLGVTIAASNSVAVNNPSEILLRQQLLSVPFAFMAANAALARAVPDGSIGAAKIANGAVGSAQLAPGIIGFAPHNIQIFTTSGTWIQPPGVSNVYVKVIGRGGNGANAGDSVGHGGGGGYAEGVIGVNNNVVVTIAAVNSFAGLATIQATAGNNGSGQQGGVGGMGSGGSINLAGGSGKSSASQYTNEPGGAGGDTPMGFGGAGGGYGSASNSGGNGTAFGGGGGGATNLGNGGVGDSGAVIVYY